MFFLTKGLCIQFTKQFMRVSKGCMILAGMMTQNFLWGWSSYIHLYVPPFKHGMPDDYEREFGSFYFFMTSHKLFVSSKIEKKKKINKRKQNKLKKIMQEAVHRKYAWRVVRWGEWYRLPEVCANLRQSRFCDDSENVCNGRRWKPSWSLEMNPVDTGWQQVQLAPTFV